MTKSYSLIGANFSTTYTTAAFAVGECVIASDDNEYVFVQQDTSGANLSANDAVIINENYTASQLSTGSIDTGKYVGVDPNGMAAGEYGWVARKGSNVKVNADNKPAAFTQLSQPNSTDGAVDTSGTTNLNGIVLVNQPTTTDVTAVECILNYPTVA